MANKSSSEWSEPQADWIPIGRAVLRFGVAGSHRPVSTGATERFSLEAFEKYKTGTADVEITNSQIGPYTIDELVKILQDETQARKVEIDQEGGHFRFTFDLPGGGASCMGDAPWVILAGPDEPVTIDPRIEAEALFNKEGLVRISDEEAAQSARQWNVVRKATGLVWRRYLLPAFDRSVSAGQVRIYARVGSATDPLRRLPSDLWPRLDVLDWEHGVARDPEGTRFYSLHAADISPTTSPAQASIVADENAATKALAAELKRNPGMSRTQALSWCKGKYRLSDRGFQNRVWPAARDAAGLPRRAPPGRKKKSSR